VDGETPAVGDTHAVVLVLADAQSWARQFIHVFVSVYILLIFAYILSSWVRLGYSPTLARIQRFLHDTCDPYLRIFRRFIPPIGPIDVSPIVGVIVLVVIDRVLTSVI
jgi:YggT family protein